MSFEVFPPYGPMLAKTKKDRKCNVLKNKQRSGDMVKRYLSTKFGINLFDGSGKKRFMDGRTDGRTDRWTDDRRMLTMDDGRPHDDNSSAVQ